MKLGITGSRRLTNIEERIIFRFLIRKLSNCRCAIAHGGSRGVDEVANKVALKLGLTVYVFRPRSWDKESLLMRNIELVKWSDKVIAIFVREITNGTGFTLTAATLLGKAIEAYIVRGTEISNLSQNEIEKIIEKFDVAVRKRIIEKENK